MDIKPLTGYWVCISPENYAFTATIDSEEHRSKFYAEKLVRLNWVTLMNQGWECLKCTITFTIEKS